MSKLLLILSLLALSCGKKKEETTACTSNSTPIFSSHITDPNMISFIEPMGTSNHGQFRPRTYLHISNSQTVPIYAPIDAKVVGMVYKQVEGGGQDYDLLLQVSCEVQIILGHVTTPAQKILDASPMSSPSDGTSGTGATELKTPTAEVTLQAGEQIGTSKGTPNSKDWDFGVYNTAVINTFAKQDRYSRDVILNATCPYDYYGAKIKATYYEKFGATNKAVTDGSCRQASMDVEGTLAGQWYLQSTDNGTSTSTGLAISRLLDNSVLIDITGNKVQDLNGQDPATVTSACYKDKDYSNKWTYIKLISTTSLGIYHGDSGGCPSDLPSDYKVYVR